MPQTLSKTLNVLDWALESQSVFAGDCHGAFSIAWNSQQAFKVVCKTFRFKESVGELIGVHSEITISKVGHMNFDELIHTSIESGKADAVPADVLFLSVMAGKHNLFTMATVLHQQTAQALIARSNVIQAAHRQTTSRN